MFYKIKNSSKLKSCEFGPSAFSEGKKKKNDKKYKPNPAPETRWSAPENVCF